MALDTQIGQIKIDSTWPIWKMRSFLLTTHFKGTVRMVCTLHPFYKQFSAGLFPLGDQYPQGWQHSPGDFESTQRVLNSDQSLYRFALVVPPDWLVIDIDPRNGGSESFERLRNELQEDLWELARVIVQTGGGGWHLYFGCDATAMTRKSIEGYRGIEFLRSQPDGTGIVNVIGAGSRGRPDQAGDYVMLKCLGESWWLSSVPASLLELIRREKHEGSGEQKVASEEDLWRARRAMASMPAELAEDRDDWIRIGMACKSIGEEMFDPWVAWSSQASTFVSDADCLDRWQTLQPSGEIGIGTLIHESRDPVPSVDEMFGHLLAGGSAGIGIGLPQFLRNFIPQGKGGVPLGLPQILTQFDWNACPLKACQGVLFVDEGGSIRILDKVPKLFAWLREMTTVQWRSGTGDFTTKEEFFEALVRAAPRYDWISVTPHYPPVEGVYYVNQIEVGHVDKLLEFVNHFNPATEEDRQLMIAAIVTPFWGGSGGERPMFTVTSPDSQGAGKTTFCQAISKLLGLGKGSAYRIRKNSEFEDLPRAMGSASAVNPESNRIVVIDNYRGAALGSSDIESMLTESELQVWKLYHGSVTVPNLFTWYCTGNHIDMSEDLATRAVEISIRKPAAYSAVWSEKLARWDLREVIGGIAAFFEREITPPAKVTRFDRWSYEILGRLPGAAGLVTLIEQRVEDLSVAADDAHEMHELLKIYVAELRKQDSPETVHGKLLIQMSTMATMLNFMGIKTPSGKRWNNRYLGRMLKMSAARLGLEHYRDMNKRGYLWNPENN